MGNCVSGRVLASQWPLHKWNRAFNHALLQLSQTWLQGTGNFYLDWMCQSPLTHIASDAYVPRHSTATLSLRCLNLCHAAYLCNHQFTACFVAICCAVLIADIIRGKTFLHKWFRCRDEPIKSMGTRQGRKTHKKSTLLRKHGRKEKDTKTTLHLLHRYATDAR